jgi:hypothetical protein
MDATLAWPQREDVHTTLCRADYYTGHETLFPLLEASLPFAQWGRVDVDRVDEYGVEMPTRKLYPRERRWDETRPVDYSEQGARVRCQYLLREILSIVDLNDQLDFGIENSEWRRARWRVTLRPKRR